MTFIVKNLLSKDAIITFVADTVLYLTRMFILNDIFFRVKVPFNVSRDLNPLDCHVRDAMLEKDAAINSSQYLYRRLMS